MRGTGIRQTSISIAEEKGHAPHHGLPLRLPARLPPGRRVHDHHLDRRPGGQRRGGAAGRPGLPRRGRRAGRVPGADAVRVLDRGPADAGHPAGRGAVGAARGGRRVGRAAAGAGGGRAAAAPASHLQHRGGGAPGPHPRGGAQVLPADLPGVLRAAAGGAGRRRARDDPDRRPGGAVRTGPAVRRDRPARVRAARRDLRGHVGAGAPQRGGRAGRGDRAGQPVRQPDHRRARRGPAPDVPIGLVALPGRLPVRGGRGG